jgi:hypothetical protein
MRPSPFVSSFTGSLSILKISCARWRRPSRSKIVDDNYQGEADHFGTKVVSHGRYVAFRMAEISIPRNLFADILRLIGQLRPPPLASTAYRSGAS